MRRQEDPGGENGFEAGTRLSRFNAIRTRFSRSKAAVSVLDGSARFWMQTQHNPSFPSLSISFDIGHFSNTYVSIPGVALTCEFFIYILREYLLRSQGSGTPLLVSSCCEAISSIERALELDDADADGHTGQDLVEHAWSSWNHWRHIGDHAFGIPKRNNYRRHEVEFSEAKSPDLGCVFSFPTVPVSLSPTATTS